ncbi:MAG: TraB/GumN family protein [Planctomycetes bacterium]|nr:TraB/GumN family protein [Planctomycetota bacterium]
MHLARPARLAAALLALALAPAVAQDAKVQPTERPFLWVIEGDTPSFVYGTIHVPDPRVTTLPAVVSQAIDMADGLFTEVPMDPGMQMAMMRHIMLPPGQGLSTRISPELYKRLDAYVKGKGLPGAAAFEQIKVWVTGMQLQLLEFAPQLQAGGKSLDQGLYDRAREAKKEVGGLETLQEQLGCFDVLSAEEQARMLEHALDQLEAPAEGDRTAPFEELIVRYLAGDLDALVESLNEQQMGSDEEMSERLKKALITDRNHRMAERIVARLGENPGKSYFFAVGTAHHHGEEGVIALLEAQGLTLRRLTAKDAGTLKRAPAGAGR